MISVCAGVGGGVGDGGVFLYLLKFPTGHLLVYS